MGAMRRVCRRSAHGSPRSIKRTGSPADSISISGLVEGTVLPFDDDSFDAVVYTHVIEHVGGRDDQHWSFVGNQTRVLRDEGVPLLSRGAEPVDPTQTAFQAAVSKLAPGIPRVRLCENNRTRRAGTIAAAVTRRLLRLFAGSGFRGEEVTAEVLEAVLRDRLRNPFRPENRLVSRRIAVAVDAVDPRAGLRRPSGAALARHQAAIHVVGLPRDIPGAWTGQEHRHRGDIVGVLGRPIGIGRDRSASVSSSVLPLRLARSTTIASTNGVK